MGLNLFHNVNGKVKMDKSNSSYTKKSIGIIVIIILALSFLSVHAFVSFIQECKGSQTGGLLTNCVFSGNITAGNEMICGISYQSGVTITGNPGTTGVVMTKRISTLTSGSHALNSTLWTAPITQNQVTPTIQFQTSSLTQTEIACTEYSGTNNVVITTKSATGTSISNAVNFPLAVAAFSPTIGDLIYAYGSGDPCGGSNSGAITYSNGFTEGISNTITENILGTCRTLGAVQFKLGQVDEYDAFIADSTTTTASITWTFNTQQGINTGDWSEMVIEMQATQFTTTSTTTITNTIDNNDGVYIILLFLVVLFGLSLSYRKPKN